MVELEAALDASPDALEPSSIPLEPGRPPAAQPARPGPPDPHTRVRAMVVAHFDVVWRALRRLGVSPDAVDDMAQQVFLVASRKVDIIEVGGERAYLLGIAVRVASDARRAERRRREVPQEDDDRLELATSLPSVEELVDQKRARELLDQMLATMPEELRQVFVLFEIEGVAIAQIAETLEIPVGTVGSRIRRARELFQKKVRRAVRPAGELVGEGKP